METCLNCLQEGNVTKGNSFPHALMLDWLKAEESLQMNLVLVPVFS